ncbi:MAG: hypothetical protein IGQ88_03235 [Gloeomargaritaceae cyanobacterium C42_A2020_066]|nr:hypothetical protein [Gloeomargaritaceae cyanobacterium C42_A2020_066]
MTPKSGLLLSGCCVSAIAAVGSVFELSYGHPQLGTPLTSLILALTVPLGIYLFYAATQAAKPHS